MALRFDQTCSRLEEVLRCRTLEGAEPEELTCIRRAMWRARQKARHFRGRASLRKEPRRGSVRGGTALPRPLEGEPGRARWPELARGHFARKFQDPMRSDEDVRLLLERLWSVAEAARLDTRPTTDVLRIPGGSGSLEGGGLPRA